MLKKLGVMELINSIKNQITVGTGYPCLDTLPVLQEVPAYYVQYVGRKSSDTEIMYCDTFTVIVHVLGQSLEEVNLLLDKLANTLEADITIPEAFTLLQQMDLGVLAINNFENEQKRAKHVFQFQVCYGLKIKN